MPGDDLPISRQEFNELRRDVVEGCIISKRVFDVLSGPLDAPEKGLVSKVNSHDKELEEIRKANVVKKVADHDELYVQARRVLWSGLAALAASIGAAIIAIWKKGS